MNEPKPKPKYTIVTDGVQFRIRIGSGNAVIDFNYKTLEEAQKVVKEYEAEDAVEWKEVEP